MNEKFVVRDRIVPLWYSAGYLISSDADMSTILNGFFASVFTNEITNNIPEFELPGEVKPLENIHFIVDEVQRQLIKLNIY